MIFRFAYLRGVIPDGFITEMSHGPGWGYCNTWTPAHYRYPTRPAMRWDWYNL